MKTGPIGRVSAYGILIAGCAMPTLGSSDAGTASTSSTGDASTASPAATGAGCATDPTSGVTLCTAISLCPSVTVDSDQYPDCGFRIQGTVLDLECVCSGSVCPIGVPTTCADAQQLLQEQSELAVCTQVSEGRCTGGQVGPTSDAGNGGCDPTCSSMCAGEPGCIVACGC
jgi:hypothetical protein